jgi:hypothetical protein
MSFLIMACRAFLTGASGFIVTTLLVITARTLSSVLVSVKIVHPPVIPDSQSRSAFAGM